MSLLLDISGFEALFQVNYRALCATSYRIVQDRDAAEDIVQDIFFKLWEKKDILTINTSLKAYLFQSAINQSINYNKKYKNSLSREGIFNAELGSETDFTSQQMDFKETSIRVDAAIKALPEACRTIFVLSRYEQLSYKEIAKQLEISVKTVENQMTKALKHLRNWLLLLHAFLIFNFF